MKYSVGGTSSEVQEMVMDVEDELTKAGLPGVAGNSENCKESKNRKIHFNQ